MNLINLRLLGWRPVAFALACALLALASINAAAQPAADFYKGKTLTIISGEPPGGAADLYARAFAAHIGRHLPGQPSVIVQAMPGASSIIATSYLYQKAPRDGTTLLMPLTTALFAGVFGRPANSEAQRADTSQPSATPLVRVPKMGQP